MDIGAAGEIGGRFAAGHARFDPFGKQLSLRRRQPGIEEGIERVDRQFEAVEDQEGRIVAGRRRAMAEAEIGGTEAADRIAPEVAEGEKFGDDQVNG